MKDTREINIGPGMVALVDESDYGWLSEYKWRGRREPSGAGYAYLIRGHRSERTTVYMHRLIIGAPNRSEVDHINGDGLDNRRDNLRLCRRGQNEANKPKYKGPFSSKYKGVSYYRSSGKWEAYIHVNGRKKRLGWFSDELLAAKAYDLAAVVLFQEFARTNVYEVAA